MIIRKIKQNVMVFAEKSIWKTAQLMLVSAICLVPTPLQAMGQIPSQAPINATGRESCLISAITPALTGPMLIRGKLFHLPLVHLNTRSSKVKPGSGVESALDGILPMALLLISLDSKNQTNVVPAKNLSRKFLPGRLR